MPFFTNLAWSFAKASVILTTLSNTIVLCVNCLQRAMHHDIAQWFPEAFRHFLLYKAKGDLFSLTNFMTHYWLDCSISIKKLFWLKLWFIVVGHWSRHHNRHACFHRYSHEVCWTRKPKFCRLCIPSWKLLQNLKDLTSSNWLVKQTSMSPMLILNIMASLFTPNWQCKF